MKEAIITLIDALILGFFAVKTVDLLMWLCTFVRELFGWFVDYLFERFGGE